MSGNIAETGYLETLYLSEYSYLSGQIENSICAQVELKILDQSDINMQAEMRIVDEDDDFRLATQTDMKLEAVTTELGSQVDLRIVDEADDPHVLSQVNMLVTPENRLNMQVKIGKLAHYICDGYLAEFPYLEKNYLGYRLCASQFMQVNLKKFDEVRLPTQVEMRIVDEDDDPHVLSQVEMRIKDRLNPILSQVAMKVFTENDLRTQVEGRIVDESDDPHVLTQVAMRIQDRPFPYNMQVNMLKSEKLNTQVTLVIYNTTQLRLLCEFPSRGTEVLGGNNWTSVQAVSAGDFSPNNLNTDIVEQRTQTSSVALWQLRCDTGNPNTFVDTIGIINHNFSRGATVEVAGSDDASFSSIKFTFPMTVETENMYYIAPTLPNLPARYYQFTIQDNGNPNGVLSIGTIVFGSGIIMTRKEQYINPVTFGFRHFKDTLDTEGFTSVSNDRALRRFLNLTFAQLQREGGNFRALRNYILTAKTDLKCLVIPRPSVPSALAVFSKMSQLPEEQHNAIEDNEWRIDMTFDWDESL